MNFNSALDKSVFALLICLSLGIFCRDAWAETVPEISTIYSYGTIQENIEKRNVQMGSNMNTVQIFSQKRVAKSITANDPNFPNKDFIDVSSWNGAITVDQYKKMKTYGVKGVVVKFSEGDYYTNPERYIQVKNAQAAGLTVSAYHYSKFNSEASAKKEANFFADAVAGTGLSKNIIMVNDAEDSSMTSGNVTNNSVIFSNTLKSRGYPNVIHYSMAAWITGNKPQLNSDILGKKNMWVAQYPYTPSKNNLLHKDYAAWQWASDMTFPGVNTAIGGNFDINIDYRGVFTNQVYDAIEYQKKSSFNATIQAASVSSNHGLWDGICHTQAGINYLGAASKYAGKSVEILEVAKTNKSTYWKFIIDGKTMWLDKAAFTTNLDIIKENVDFNYPATIKDTDVINNYDVYSNPKNTSIESYLVAKGTAYKGKKVTIIRKIKTNANIEYYQFAINGKVVGWLDVRAFYDPILEEKSLNLKIEVRVDAKNQGLWSAVPNSTSEAKYLGSGEKYAGKSGIVSTSIKTMRSTYYKFTIDGVTQWMDAAAFDLKFVQIVDNQAVNYKVTLRNEIDVKKHGLWTAVPYSTIEARSLGSGQPYHSQQVIVNQISRTNEGNTYYQFSMSGQVIGWLDEKAFYDLILEEKSLNLKIKVRADAKNQGLWSAVPNSTSEAKYLGSGEKYAGKSGIVSTSIKTVRSTYYKFTIDGVTQWMDAAAFDLKFVQIVDNQVVNYKVTLRNETDVKKHGLWTAVPYSTIEARSLGSGQPYHSQQVIVNQISRTNEGNTYYQFSMSGQVIGWLDEKAFYDLILEEKSLNLKIKVRADAKNQGLWSAVPNSTSEAKYLGSGEKYAGKSGIVSTSIKTMRSTYYKFTIDGVTQWMDAAAFDLKFVQIVDNQVVNYKVTLRNEIDVKKHGLWTAVPYSTIEARSLGSGQPYHSQQVIVNQISRTNEGNTYYQFSMSGQVIGWLDEKAFYDLILEEKSLNLKIKVRADAKNQGLWSAVPNSTSEAKYLGSGEKYAGKSGIVSTSIKTVRSTYYKFTIDGVTQWMDAAAFDLVTQSYKDENTEETVDSFEAEESVNKVEDSAVEQTIESVSMESSEDIPEETTGTDTVGSTNVENFE